MAVEPEPENLKGIFNSGILFPGSEQKSWFELRIQNRDGEKTAQLTLDAIGCDGITVREVQPATAALVIDGQLPMSFRLPKKEKISIILDPGESCSIQGPYTATQQAVHVIGTLLQGDTKGIIAEMVLNLMRGDQLTVIDGIYGAKAKLHGRSQISLTPGIVALMNFGSYTGYAETCQEECVSPTGFAKLPPHQIVLYAFRGPAPRVLMYNHAKHRILTAKSFTFTTGQTRQYSVNSSIQFEDVK